MKLSAIALTLLAATLLFGCLQGGTTSSPTPTLQQNISPTPQPTYASATPPETTAEPSSEEEIEQVLEEDFGGLDDESSQELENLE